MGNFTRAKEVNRAACKICTDKKDLESQFEKFEKGIEAVVVGDLMDSAFYERFSFNPWLGQLYCCLWARHVAFTVFYVLLHSSKNAFIMQLKSTFLEFLRGIHRYKFGPPKKFFRGKIIQGE